MEKSVKKEEGMQGRETAKKSAKEQTPVKVPWTIVNKVDKQNHEKNKFSA